VATGQPQVGELLAGRYLLLEVVAEDGPATLWRATDEILARAVAVKVVPVPTRAAREQAQPFLDAAVRTCVVNHPGLARVYDASVETRPGRGKDLAYVISEWVEGEPLDQHLDAVGALSGPDAADLLRQAADAVSAAHAGGILHGRLHPRNVLVTPTGRVRITDATVASALHGDPTATSATTLGVTRDTGDLAALLYAMVTVRWPSTSDLPGGSLPVAPGTEAHAMSARQVRAGVPRALDLVITRALEPGQSTLPPLPTPATLAGAVESAVAEARLAKAAPAGPRPPSRLRAAAPTLVIVGLLLAFGIGGWMLGLAVGDLRRPANAVDAIVSTAAPDAGQSNAPYNLRQVRIRDFDPAGDRQENADQVRNAVDGFPNTTWSTSRYRSSTFGGLKSGVGLLVDLGSVRRLSEVQVGFSARGARVELRVSDNAPPDNPFGANAMRTVAAATKGDQVATLRPANGTVGRYVLIWITGLPKDGDGYRVGVSELRIG
jgi:serine/threonine protein kinase